MTDTVDKPLLLEAGTPPRPTYGPSKHLIELLRFWWHMKILEKANAQYFNGLPLSPEDEPEEMK